MSKVTRKQISDCFKEAKKYLSKDGQDNKRRFICNAISVTEKASEKTKNKCSEIIRHRLNHNNTLDGWLRNVCEIESSPYDVKLLITRHAWLDSLIAEFSSK